MGQALRVKTVLGDEKEVTRTYPDGSVDCPYCQNPIRVEQIPWDAVYATCENPWCDAHPSLPPLALVTKRAQRAAKEAEEAQRRRNAEWAMTNASRVREVRDAWEKEQFARARREMTCIACLWTGPGGKPRFVKHRGPCPKSRK